MPTETADQIKDSLSQILNRHAEDLIRDTVRIIGFETVSGGTAQQEAKYRTEIPACLRWLEKRARAMGFAFREWEGRVAEIEWAIPATRDGEPRRPVLGIASHIDVVTPVGSWKFPPFSGQIEDGILYGRGIQDDKGPLIQSLYGLWAVKEAGFVPPCDVRIIIGTSEETGDWSDMQLYIDERGAPDYSYTPDADFPIITGEKGIMNVRFRASWDHLGPHPETQMEFVSLKGGERTNIVPALAEAILRFPVETKHVVMKELVRETTRFTVENHGANITLVPNNEDSEGAGYYESLVSFIGKAAHSSTPAKGHNAAIDALRFFSDIETLPPPVRAFIQFLAFIGAEPDGTNLQINSSHPFVGDTTAVLSLVEINQKGGSANMNIRPTMGFACKEVMQKAHEAARSYSDLSGLQIRIDETERLLDAIYLDPNLPGVDGFLRSLQAAYEIATGEKGEMRSIGGTTYAKALPNCCAFGPVKCDVDEELAHQADERLAVDSIHRNALIYGLSIALMGYV